MGGAVRVSIVIPTYRSEGTIERCLGALGRQTFRDFETVVVDSSPDDATARIVRAFPEAALERSSRRLAVHEARNRGAAAARGELFAFTDPDCTARPDWLEGLVGAYERERAIVGGAIEPALNGRRQRGIHRCKFGAWEARSAPGPRHMLPTANLLMDRQVWDEVGPFRLLGWSGDTELCWRAREAGHRLVFDPTAVVEHHQPPGIAAFCGERLVRGAAFARIRASTEGWSRARALAALAATPLVPLLLVVRVRPLTPSTLPVQLVGYSAWALGEARSHLAHVRAG
jgi:glycosyltransferase involved in cell wall biosynthesis